MRDYGIEHWPETKTGIKFVRVEGLAPGNALSARETALYGAFRMEKRRKEWLAGRLAAKSLLSAAANEADQSLLDISYDQLGRPACAGRIVSISHSGGWAMAAIKEGTSFIGADLEKIEERHPAWYKDYFLPGELATPDPGEATRLWAIKEALLKALGLGLAADPLSIRAGGPKIILAGKALARYSELGSPPFVVSTKPFPTGFWTAVAAAR